MRSPREFLSGEFLKVKYTRRLSTEYPPELRQVPGPIESTVMNDCHNFACLLAIQFALLALHSGYCCKLQKSSRK